MFEQLQQLPLFQGVAAERLTELVGELPFHFLKCDEGEPIVTAGDSCDKVRFVVSGSVNVEAAFSNLRVKVSYRLDAPAVIGAESLFGIAPHHRVSVVAGHGCGIMQLTKADYVTVLQSDKVFLFNIVNFLSRAHQQQTAALLALTGRDPVERLRMVIGILTTRACRDVHVTYATRDLERLTALSSRALNGLLTTLDDEGVIDRVSDNEIAVTDLPALMRNWKYEL